MTDIFTFNNAVALVILTVLEVILGIDNLVMLSVVSSKLEGEKRYQAQRIGLWFAMGMRVALLLIIGWIAGLVNPLFHVMGHAVSGRDIVMLVGGGFLLWKAIHEIHDETEGGNHEAIHSMPVSFAKVVGTIVVMDVVFSLDSVITAVGMAESVVVMIMAVVLAVFIMQLSARSISDFIEAHPTVKMLALSFLVVISVMLIAEGTGAHVPKGYLYCSMAFAGGVEFLNGRKRAKGK